MEIKFTIPLNPVTKKNSQRIAFNRRTGGRFIAPSRQFVMYQALCKLHIPEDLLFREIDRPLEVKAEFYMAKDGIVDLPNLLNALDDILVFYKVLKDDNSRIIMSHDGSRVYTDRDNPRTEIVIREIGK